MSAAGLLAQVADDRWATAPFADAARWSPEGGWDSTWDAEELARVVERECAYACVHPEGWHDRH